MEVPKLNPQQIYIFSSDSDLIASSVPAVSLKFWYMFISLSLKSLFVILLGWMAWLNGCYTQYGKLLPLMNGYTMVVLMNDFKDISN